MRIKRILYSIVFLICAFIIYYYSHFIVNALTKLKELFTSGDTPSLIISSVALLISIIALVYTIRAFWLKAGEKLRFTYPTSTSIYTDDVYLNTITLENLKDKAIVVFSIYFKIGNNSYILLEDFEEVPLIIKPFEVYSKKYDPILFYSSNQTRVKLDHLFKNRSLNRSLVLSTTNGKHEVQSYVDKWTIYRDLFGNVLTNLAKPIRLIYKDKAYGKNVDYLVDITYKSGKEQVLALTKRSYEYVTFEKLNLTKECLSSKEKLEKHLLNETHKDLKIEDVKVIEWKKEADNYRELKEDETYELNNYNRLVYKIVGPLLTRYRDYQLKKKNQNRNK